MDHIKKGGNQKAFRKNGDIGQQKHRDGQGRVLLKQQLSLD